MNLYIKRSKNEISEIIYKSMISNLPRLPSHTDTHAHTLRQAGIEENEWYTESQTQMLTEAGLVIQMRKPPGGKGQGKREGPCPFCLQRSGGAYYDNRPFLPVGILA